MMIDPLVFIESLQEAGINFFTGVPDSLLKDFCACATQTCSSTEHVIANNEGAAIAMAMGSYLASSKPGLVYMQNSGLGNCINPLTSLTDPLVFSIPMIMMIGWRGEMFDKQSQISDEPQHTKQGQITLDQLDVLDIPYEIIDGNTEDLNSLLIDLIGLANKRCGPVAIVVRKNTFSSYKLKLLEQDCSLDSREDIIREILSVIPSSVPIISTTGMASRELFELRKSAKSSHNGDLLTVGGMGLANQIAAGISFTSPDLPVVCIDGDGAVLMHAGALAISADCKNLIHIVINNEAHDSVGGQPTKGNVLEFDKIASAFGYAYTDRASTAIELKQKLSVMLEEKHGGFIEVKCKRGARKDLGRPNRTPIENKLGFMKFLGSTT